MNLHQRIDDFLEERANAESDWDEQQSAFTDFVEMELLDQRQMCASAAQQCILDDPELSPLVSSVTNACLDAVDKL